LVPHSPNRAPALQAIIVVRESPRKIATPTLSIGIDSEIPPSTAPPNLGGDIARNGSVRIQITTVRLPLARAQNTQGGNKSPHLVMHAPRNARVPARVPHHQNARIHTSMIVSTANSCMKSLISRSIIIAAVLRASRARSVRF
jgi:hypothetical protein